VYRNLIRRKDEPPSVTFMLGFGSAPIHAEKSLYELALWARGQAELAGYLTRASNAEIAAETLADSAPEPTADLASWAEFRARFGEHLRRFGHAVYDLDFAKAIAAEEPAPLIETLKFYLTGEGESPYDRQAAAVAAREQAQKSLQGRLRGLRSWMFRKLLAWAQRYAPLREDALADVGLGWPLLRRIFRELGRRLVAARALADENDVYWLKRDELEASARALDSGQSPHDSRSTIEERRRIWEREHHVTPPVVLPVKGGIRFFGFDFTKWMPARSEQAGGDTILGTGASPGRVTGAACVIRGTHEFHQMQQRGILVAKITTPAWTPLFALASGVVTDVGGLLSHGSIVAREYHIPAVLGTGVATERIQNGQRITVDGDRGVVTLAG
jgi:phosphohistidine swiveling domain-containing protein